MMCFSAVNAVDVWQHQKLAKTAEIQSQDGGQATGDDGKVIQTQGTSFVYLQRVNKVTTALLTRLNIYILYSFIQL